MRAAGRQATVSSAPSYTGKTYISHAVACIAAGAIQIHVTMAVTLRDKQIGSSVWLASYRGPKLTHHRVASIKRILNLNAPITDVDAQDELNNEPSNPSSDGAVWKVLVFDEMGRDVISSVLRVNDLRGSGV